MSEKKHNPWDAERIVIDDLGLSAEELEEFRELCGLGKAYFQERGLVKLSELMPKAIRELEKRVNDVDLVVMPMFGAEMFTNILPAELKKKSLVLNYSEKMNPFSEVVVKDGVAKSDWDKRDERHSAEIEKLFERIERTGAKQILWLDDYMGNALQANVLAELMKKRFPSIELHAMALTHEWRAENLRKRGLVTGSKPIVDSFWFAKEHPGDKEEVQTLSRIARDVISPRSDFEIKVRKDGVPKLGRKQRKLLGMLQKKKERMHY